MMIEAVVSRMACNDLRVTVSKVELDSVSKSISKPVCTLSSRRARREPSYSKRREKRCWAKSEVQGL